jgi:hypothetical protein
VTCYVYKGLCEGYLHVTFICKFPRVLEKNKTCYKGVTNIMRSEFPTSMSKINVETFQFVKVTVSHFGDRFFFCALSAVVSPIFVIAYRNPAMRFEAELLPSSLININEVKLSR